MQTLLEQILDPPLQPVLYKLDEATGKYIPQYFWDRKYNTGTFASDRIWVDECPDITDEMMEKWMFEGCDRQRSNQQAQGEDPTAPMKIRFDFDFNADPPEGTFYSETMRQMKKNL